ncbi:hypothetical protein NITLEN_20693 [Nitrospira lenta]|uniref:Uncharacterized protein n=1 Tax=Nitrospira lenta TaxID=1436998 RepID=A0A330L5K7_9BACT|nr:hypothetical protein NITLEN_20693 [Nitrospira lenta]
MRFMSMIDTMFDTGLPKLKPSAKH